MHQLLADHEVFEIPPRPLQYERNTHHRHMRHVQVNSQQQVDAEDRQRLCRDYLALVGSRKKFCELL